SRRSADTEAEETSLGSLVIRNFRSRPDLPQMQPVSGVPELCIPLRISGHESLISVPRLGKGLAIPSPVDAPCRTPMPKSPIRVGIIGMGGYAARHHEALLQLENAGEARLVCTCDPAPSKFAT